MGERSVFAIAGIAFLGVSLVIVLKMLGWVFDEPDKRILANPIKHSTSEKQDWRFGSVIEMSGSDFVVLPLLSILNNNSVVVTYDSGRSSTRNYLFVDSNTQNMRWLLPDNDSVFIERQIISTGKRSENNLRVNALMFEIVKNDTNGDGEVNSKDTHVIAFALPDGSNYIEILDDVDVLLGKSVNDNKFVTLFYQREGVAYVGEFDLEEFIFRKQTALPVAGVLH